MTVCRDLNGKGPFLLELNQREKSNLPGEIGFQLAFYHPINTILMNSEDPSPVIHL